MIVSGVSGNELFCLHEKGFEAGELVVGNSVCSLGIVGGIGAFGRNLAGGEVANVTSLISEGRHAAIDRMESEAKKGGAAGVTSVVSELRTLGGYTEFLSQGTAIRGGSQPQFFSTASSGMELRGEELWTSRGRATRRCSSAWRVACTRSASSVASVR
jgi:uncharacterized protein YbjQ (UPF0145 family)